uniref:Uncharacterized protein n=1 Tax=viral metagenome TaxID=1070528 RepID=A0A6H2A388_9ZZZZ
MNWMTETPKIEVEYGYPLQRYTFTGEYSLDTGSALRVAIKNRRKRYLPIYKNKKGEIFCDATQSYEKIPMG